MITITVFKFDAADGASGIVDLVEKLSGQRMIALLDAASVTWPEGKNHPRTSHLTELTGEEALDDTFWGLLFSLIFFVPYLGLAFGAAMGALFGHFSQYGIDKGFIRLIQEKVTEGESAIFLVTAEAVPDGVSALIEARGLNVEWFLIVLSEEQEALLREDFLVSGSESNKRTNQTIG